MCVPCIFSQLYTSKVFKDGWPRGSFMDYLEITDQNATNSGKIWHLSELLKCLIGLEISKKHYFLSHETPHRNIPFCLNIPFHILPFYIIILLYQIYYIRSTRNGGKPKYWNGSHKPVEKSKRWDLYLTKDKIYISQKVKLFLH